jgi:hypothetical protein
MVSIRFWFCSGVLAFLLCAASGNALAQQPTQAQATAIRNACRNDYMAHCSSVPAGTKDSLQCLAQNMSALSPPCASAVKAAVPPPATASAPGTPPAANAPPPAASAPPPAAASPPRPMTPREEAALLRRSCGADFRAYCSGVQLGGGRAAACLMQNQARLSPPCKAALAERQATQ